jgi:uncharacterized protein
VRLLFDAGADIHAASGPEGHKYTALMGAAMSECCSTVVDVLLRAGADPCVVTSPSCKTALHLAAEQGLAESCEKLLTGAATLLEMKDTAGNTASMPAASDATSDVLQLFIRHGANVNAVNVKMQTALIAASLDRPAEIASCLLDAGADVNAIDSQGHSALLAAAQSDDSALVHLLLDHGADINIKDSHDQNALYFAVCQGHVQMIETLINCKLSITAINDDGQTLLMSAAASEQTTAAEWLIEHGVAVNAASKAGYTALHYASCSCDDITMTELLLAHGAEANMCSVNGNAALAVVANHGNLKCVRVLIAAGADVNSANRDGISSLHAAIMEHHGNIAIVLLERGATVVMNSVLPVQCSQSIDGCGNCCCIGLTALMMCTTVDTVKVLLTAGADANIANDAGDTCLHLAVRHKLIAPVVCLLIKAGVDLHAVNNDGKTAAQIAHDKGNALIEQLLYRAATQQQGH